MHIQTDVREKFLQSTPVFTRNTFNCSAVSAESSRSIYSKFMMRNLRTATPNPEPSHYDDAVCPDILPSRRLSLVSQTHLPALREGSLDCSELSRIVHVSRAFSTSELGKTEIIALVGSPSHPRRGHILKSALERRRSQENDLPDLNSRDITQEEPDAVPASTEWVQRLQRPQHYKLTRAVSHPVISKARNFTLAAKASSCSNSKSLPRLDSTEPSRTINENRHTADLRRHIQQENMDYDFVFSKAVILERFLNSQN